MHKSAERAREHFADASVIYTGEPTRKQLAFQLFNVTYGLSALTTVLEDIWNKLEAIEKQNSARGK